MRKQLIALITIEAFVLLIIAARNRSAVSLAIPMPKVKYNHLASRYSALITSLVPDSLLNNWDSTEYISFEPKIALSFSLGTSR